MLGLLAVSSEASAQRLFKGAASQSRGVEKSGKKTSAHQFHLSRFQSVGGTSVLMASLTNLGDRSESSTKFSSPSSGSSSFVANYVFFDTTTDSAEAMFPNNEARIIALTPLSETAILEEGGDGDRPYRTIELVSARDRSNTEPIHSVRWFAVEFVADDTNGDGNLTTQDRHRLAIADAAGRGLAEVIPNLGEVFARKMIDGDTLLIIHGSQDQPIAIRIDLPKRKVISAKPLPDFGAR